MRSALTRCVVGLVLAMQTATVAGTAMPSETVSDIAVGNVARRTDGNEWSWTVFIMASEDVLAKVACVEYTLHPTFPEPIQRNCDRGSLPGKGFALSAKGWGTFRILVKVELKDGRIRHLRHDLRFSNQAEGWVLLPRGAENTVTIPVTAAASKDGDFRISLAITRRSDGSVAIQPKSVEIHQDGAVGSARWRFAVQVDGETVLVIPEQSYSDWQRPTHLTFTTPGTTIPTQGEDVGIGILGFR